MYITSPPSHLHCLKGLDLLRVYICVISRFTDGVLGSSIADLLVVN